MSDHFYLAGGFADINGDPTDLDDGFDSLFNDVETLKSLELCGATHMRPFSRTART